MIPVPLHDKPRPDREVRIKEHSPPRTTFRSLLEDLLVDCRGLTALLVTRQGTVVADAGATSQINTTAIAALVAGVFSATREVARLVGEQQFCMLLQQGERRHIHIALVSDEIMMVVVFEDHRRIGVVRHESRKAGEKLVGMLSAGQEEDAEPEVAAEEFREYALNLIDRIFQP